MVEIKEINKGVKIMRKFKDVLKRMSEMLFVAVNAKEFNQNPLATAKHLGNYQLNIKDKYSRE